MLVGALMQCEAISDFFTVLDALVVRETSQWERIQAAKAAMSGVKEIAVPKAQ